MENTVETNLQGLVPDDAALMPEQQTAEPVSDLNEIVNEQPSEEPAQKEPGYIRQRVDKAVQKAIRETEARMQAMFDAQLAPLRESMMERQAEDLVAQGEFKSKERALEYVRLKNGASVPTTPTDEEQTPRDAQGRFATKQQDDPMVSARAQLLAAQADKIRDRKGLDVMQAFNTNPDIRDKVLSGEWDFYDVAENMHRLPPTIRTTNGASGGGSIDIAHMTDEQFERLNQNLAAGKTYK